MYRASSRLLYEARDLKKKIEVGVPAMCVYVCVIWLMKFEFRDNYGFNGRWEYT